MAIPPKPPAAPARRPAPAMAPRRVDPDDADVGDVDSLARSRAELAKMEQGMLIDRRDLSGELERHAERYWHASKQHSFAVSYRDQAKKDLAETEAQADVDVRQRLAATANGARVTEGTIKAQIELDPKVKNASKLFMDWSLLADLWRGLTTAISDRRWAISDLVKLEQISGFDAAIKVGDTRVLDTAAADRVRNAG